jgi:hypothetical protein
MHSLRELISSAGGRRLLESRGVFTETDIFLQRLEPPRSPDLAEALGLDANLPLVYAGQQTLADLPASVLAKFRSARDLATRGASAPLLWLDTDRAGSTKLATTIVWPAEPQPASIRLIPQRLAERESRFAGVGHDRLQQVFSWLRERLDETLTGEARVGAAERLDRFSAAVAENRPGTLAEVNRNIGEFLLRERLAFAPPSATISQLSSLEAFRLTLREALASLDEVTAVFNETIALLLRLDVDPQVSPLSESYLPLRTSCPECHARLPLSRASERGATYAVGRCSCGGHARFRLGDGTPGLGELEETELWSVDVTLPIYLNEMASGVVAGKSSALYGLVLNEVLECVLRRPPIPIVVPSELAEEEPSGLPGDSLLHRFLVGT